MQQDKSTRPAYVIKPEELLALNYLGSDYPHPVDAEWINRGTDQKLKTSTIEMLQRTLFRDIAPPSVVELHRSAGLRVIFRNEEDRRAFASAFIGARQKEASGRKGHLTSIFSNRDEADRAIESLIATGIAQEQISIIWRVSQLENSPLQRRDGHSKLSVASAIAGGGVAGAILGIAVLAIPGIGPVAAAGALAATVPSVASVSGIIGATGGAIARMLDDHDVDGIAANHFEQQIQRGKVFVTVDISDNPQERDRVRELLRAHGGKTTMRG